ncbi:MAG: pyrroline-5-carboxylate reductase [Defluviitaleaceae bacterium]|nr:pyrroline-5-carboxylate reductase [Defluviitaleaceae bacterium]
MKIGFIGAGNMAEAIIKGIVKNGVDPNSVYINDLDRAKVKNLVKTCSVKGLSANLDIVKECGLIILAVKPHLLKPVIGEIRHLLNPKEHTLVSIAAGISLEMLEGFANVAEIPVIRVMPNVNSAVCMGMTAMCKNIFVGDAPYNYTKGLFEKIGKTAELSEGFFPLFGALAGSSPAFTYLFIESLAKGAHKAGMPKAQAVEIAAQAVLGSAALILESGKHPWELIDSVCSPGGTTIEGICALEREGFPAAVVSCMDTCMAKDKLIMERNK